MEINKVKQALIEQRKMNLSGSLYHKTQIDFAYNTNYMEGSTITPDETASIYETGTILTSSDKVNDYVLKKLTSINNLKDATETKNHFTLFKYMLDTIEEKLSEDMIKKFHFILKDGTLTDSEKEWFNVGDYKKRKNFVGNIIKNSGIVGDNFTNFPVSACNRFLQGAVIISKHNGKTIQFPGKQSLFSV